MVWTADVDVGERVGAVQELVGRAQWRHRLPDEHRFLGVRVHGFATAEDGGYEVDAARGRADHVKGFGEEKGRR